MMHHRCHLLTSLTRTLAQLWWGDDWRLAGSILDNMLISLNLTSPGRVRAVSFLKTRYPTITALNKAWYVLLPPPSHRIDHSLVLGRRLTRNAWMQELELHELRHHQNASQSYGRAHDRL
jgi:hypothetical protein